MLLGAMLLPLSFSTRAPSSGSVVGNPLPAAATCRLRVSPRELGWARRCALRTRRLACAAAAVFSRMTGAVP
eukprot:5973566-Alexandrium_andersonii.AAC.1